MSTPLETLEQKPVEDRLTTEVLPQTELQADFVALAEHVTKKGDVIDRLPLLRRAAGVGTVAMIGVGVTGVYAGMDTSGFNAPFGDALTGFRDLVYEVDIPAFNIAAGVLLGATTGLAVAAKPLARRYHSRKPRTQLDLQQHIADKYFEGEAVELYRVRPSGKRSEELQVFWHAANEADSYSPAALTAKLRKIADGMTAAKAKRAVIPHDAIADYTGDIADDAVEYTDVDGWLTHYKRTKTKDKVNGDREVALVDATTLEKLIELTQEAQHEEPLHSIMKVLAHTRPGHPLLARYHIGIKDEAENRKIFTEAAKRSVNSHLHQTDRARGDTDAEQPLLRTGKKVASMGQVQFPDGEDPFIRWQQTGRFGHGEKSDLLTYFRTDSESLEWLPQRFTELPPHKVVEQCELAALLCMHDRISPAAVDEGALSSIGEGQDDSSTVMEESSLQARIADRVLLPGRKQPDGAKEATGISTNPNKHARWKHAALRLAPAALAGIVLGMGVVSVDMYEYDKAQTATTAALGESQFGEDSAKTAARGAYAAAQLDNPIHNMTEGLFGVQQGYEGFIGSQWNKLVGTLGNQYTAPEQASIENVQQTASNQESGIGNVPDGPNEVVWQLEPKGMSSAGYWVDATYDSVNLSQMTWNQDSSLQPYSKAAEDAGADTAQTVAAEWAQISKLGDAESTDALQQVIKVGQPIVFAENENTYQRWVGNGILPNDMSVYIVPVPVLEGTKVVAATFAGQGDIGSQVLADGTTVLLVPVKGNDESGDLAYWVAPDKNAPKPKAVDQVSGEDIDDAQLPLQQTWAQYGVPSDDSGVERIQDEQSRLQAMQYSTQPLPVNMPTDNLTPNSYVNQVLKGNEANCNVANTALAISNPDELNLATGFNNSNTDQQETTGNEVLSSHEEHAFTVDHNGKVFDATSANVPDDEKQFFSEGGLTKPPDPRKNRLETLDDGLIAAGGIALAAVGLWQRRRFRRMATGAKRKGAELALMHIDPLNAAFAYNAYTKLVFGHSDALDLSGEEKVIIRQKVQEGTSRHNDGFKGALATDPDGLAHALSNIDKLSPDGRKLVRRARRILHLLQTASPKTNSTE